MEGFVVKTKLREESEPRRDLKERMKQTIVKTGASPPESPKLTGFPPTRGVFHKICGKAVDIVSIRVKKAEFTGAYTKFS